MTVLNLQTKTHFDTQLTSNLSKLPTVVYTDYGFDESECENELEIARNSRSGCFSMQDVLEEQVRADYVLSPVSL